MNHCANCDDKIRCETWQECSRAERSFKPPTAIPNDGETPRVDALLKSHIQSDNGLNIEQLKEKCATDYGEMLQLAIDLERDLIAAQAALAEARGRIEELEARDRKWAATCERMTR